MSATSLAAAPPPPPPSAPPVAARAPAAAAPTGGDFATDLARAKAAAPAATNPQGGPTRCVPAPGVHTSAGTAAPPGSGGAPADGTATTPAAAAGGTGSPASGGVIAPQSVPPALPPPGPQVGAVPVGAVPVGAIPVGAIPVGANPVGAVVAAGAGAAQPGSPAPATKAEGGAPSRRKVPARGTTALPQQAAAIVLPVPLPPSAAAASAPNPTTPGPVSTGPATTGPIPAAAGPQAATRHPGAPGGIPGLADRGPADRGPHVLGAAASVPTGGQPVTAAAQGGAQPPPLLPIPAGISVPPGAAGPGQGTGQGTGQGAGQGAGEGPAGLAGMVPPPHAAGSAATQAVPAAQLAPALVALGRGPAGSHRLSLQLAPPELGRVEIRLDRTADGPARVVVSVQRPETLHLLLRDQAGLHRALDQAGVSAQGRSLSFQLGSGGGGNPSGGASSRPDGAAGGRGEPSGVAATPPPPAPRFVRAGLDITA